MKTEIIDLLIDSFDLYIVSDCYDYATTKPILLGDFNPISNNYPNIMNRLEDDYELFWVDDYLIDHNNDICYRSTPDSYGWQPNYILDEFGDIMNIGDFEALNKDDFVEFLEINGYLDSPTKAINLNGFIPQYGEDITEKIHNYSELESGWYRINDDPEEIFRLAKNKYRTKRFFFNIENVEQFRINFKIYAI